jgi:hypothetical protein
MSKFTVEIDCGNAAFYEVDREYEVARILRELANSLESGRIGRAYLHDNNGNRVGTANFEGE